MSIVYILNSEYLNVVVYETRHYRYQILGQQTINSVNKFRRTLTTIHYYVANAYE